MASMVKRNKTYSVVYTYINDTGKKHQKWKSFISQAEAKERKSLNTNSHKEHLFFLSQQQLSSY